MELSSWQLEATKYKEHADIAVTIDGEKRLEAWTRLTTGVISNHMEYDVRKRNTGTEYG